MESCSHLEEKEGACEEGTHKRLHDRALEEHHQSYKDKAAQHLDQLPPEKCGLVPAHRV